MPIRVACPDCSCRVSAPDAAAGTVYRCPKCGAAMELPDAAAVARHRRATTLADRDDESDDDRPRRRKAPAGGFPAWAAVLMGLALVVAVGVGVYLAVRGKGGAKGDGAADGGGDALGGLLGGPAGPPARYVTGESEKRFETLARDRGKLALTEADVLATMGEPTRKEPNGLRPDRRTGRPVAVETWYWRVEGTGLESTIVMGGGRVQTWVFGVDVRDDIPMEDDDPPPTRPDRRTKPTDPPDDDE